MGGGFEENIQNDSASNEQTSFWVYKQLLTKRTPKIEHVRLPCNKLMSTSVRSADNFQKRISVRCTPKPAILVSKYPVFTADN